MPKVVEASKEWGNIPIIAAGGIWDRKDIDTMLSLGASGVQMATRFLGTKECDAKVYADLLPTLKKKKIFYSLNRL